MEWSNGGSFWRRKILRILRKKFLRITSIPKNNGNVGLLPQIVGENVFLKRLFDV